MRFQKLAALLFAASAAFTTLASRAAAQAADTLRGVVSDSASSAPLEGVEVSSDGSTTQTAANGSFMLVISATGVHEFSAAPGFVFDPSHAAFIWPASAGPVDITVRDAFGRATAERNGGVGNSFSFAALPPGLYTASIRVGGAEYLYQVMHLRGAGDFARASWARRAASAQATAAGAAAKPASELAAAVTSKSHDLAFAKTGYVGKTVTVPAGTPGTTSVTVKLAAEAAGKWLETLSVSAALGTAAGKVSLDSNEIYLIKASGSIDFGVAKIDAEYDFFSGIGKDSAGGADVGVDFGVRTPRIAKLVPPLVGRMHWVGPYRADHTYYVVVNGEGQPMSLKLLRGGNGPGSGNITVSVMKLSPTNSLGKELDTTWAHTGKDSVHSHLATTLGTQYILQCDGQGHVGGARLAMGDADYMDYDANGVGRLDVGDVNTDYGLGVDEIYPGTKANTLTPRKRWWGNFRKDHIYYMVFTGTGHTIDYIYYDSGYGDNLASDHLTVRVFAAP